MKKVVLLFTFISMAFLSASAQNVINANSAGSHVGEQVNVLDSVYNIKVYNDSTAVVDLGGKNNKSAMNVVFDFNSGFKFDAAMLKAFKKSKIAISGFVVMVDNQPAIVMTDKKNLKFLSKTVNQKWLAMSQLPEKKEFK